MSELACVSIERNWQNIHGKRQRTRGWQVVLGPLVVRYGIYWRGEPELRLSVSLSSSMLLFVVFPRGKVEQP